MVDEGGLLACVALSAGHRGMFDGGSRTRGDGSGLLSLRVAPGTLKLANMSDTAESGVSDAAMAMEITSRETEMIGPAIIES